MAAEIAHDSDALLSTLPHYYRGEISQANNTQNRIDQTTNWAATIIAAIVSVVFADQSVAPKLLLVGMLTLGVFLSYEVRRYRVYDLSRARVRFVQQNVFANALDPQGVEHATWREELSRDLRYPTFKVSNREALSRRLRRIYGLLFVVVGVAWVGKVTFLTPRRSWADAAALPGVPGEVVTGTLVVFYLAIGTVALWPSTRGTAGEIHGEKTGEWKQE